jgi:hypothetical protein
VWFVVNFSDTTLELSLTCLKGFGKLEKFEKIPFCFEHLNYNYSESS